MLLHRTTPSADAGGHTSGHRELGSDAAHPPPGGRLICFRGLNNVCCVRPEVYFTLFNHGQNANGMTWVKNALVDIAVTVLILYAVTHEVEWAQWVVWGYTGLMLLLKMVMATAGDLIRQFKESGDNAPVWFYHVLYAINVLALFVYGWMATGLAWVGIWALSAYVEYRKSIFRKTRS